ncbi:MAG: hypothetical protein J2P52_09090 [Blastocatellia bacterium]|nr:hypothetical protein [Blastocatellia bacterium]
MKSKIRQSINWAGILPNAKFIPIQVAQDIATMDGAFFRGRGKRKTQGAEDLLCRVALLK